ncbi:MAG: DUF1275 domain-containing protein [Caldilineaceae bacterium]|nr:DUF1275 domain-containing protein [Caldilineaceae bacterium]
MFRQLPRWIWLGAAVLSLSAGLINAVAFSGFSHNAVTHVTGTVTKGAIALASGDFTAYFLSTGLIMAFGAGAMISGIIIGNEHLRLGRRYGLALLLESGLLTLSYYLFTRGVREGELFASAACGLQNAMVATYSGNAIRTTHMTGVVSDLGSLIGNFLARRKVDARQFLLLSTVFFNFYLGGCIGTYLFQTYEFGAILAPAALTLFTGIAYFIYRVQKHVRLQQIYRMAPQHYVVKHGEAVKHVEILQHAEVLQRVEVVQRTESQE